MKKTMIVVCLLAGLLLALGCSPSNLAGAGSKGAVPAGYERITIPGGSMGGGAYAKSVGVAKILNTYFKDVEWSARSGGTVAGLVGVQEGTEKMSGLGKTYWVEAYKQGTEDKSRLRAITAFSDMPYFFIVPKDKPWENITDIPKGTTWLSGSPGSTIPVVCKTWIEAVGLKVSDYKLVELAKADSSQAWQDRTLDVYFFGGSLPVPALTEMQTGKRPFKVFGFTPDQAAKAKGPLSKLGFSVEEVPIKEYQSNDIDKNVIGARAPSFLGVRDDFPEDMAYKITKILTERHEELVKAVPAAFILTPENTFKWLPGAAPVLKLHAGAERYYREAGYLK